MDLTYIFASLTFVIRFTDFILLVSTFIVYSHDTLQTLTYGQEGWSGGAMMLSKLPVSGVLLIWIIVGHDVPGPVNK